jgi:hypothetical protein
MERLMSSPKQGRVWISVNLLLEPIYALLMPSALLVPEIVPVVVKGPVFGAAWFGVVVRPSAIMPPPDVPFVIFHLWFLGSAWMSAFWVTVMLV